MLVFVDSSTPPLRLPLQVPTLSAVSPGVSLVYSTLTCHYQPLLTQNVPYCVGMMSNEVTSRHY